MIPQLGGEPQLGALAVAREADRLEVVERLIVFAEERGHTVLDLALSWVASRPQVASVLIFDRFTLYGLPAAIPAAALLLLVALAVFILLRLLEPRTRGTG